MVLKEGAEVPMTIMLVNQYVREWKRKLDSFDQPDQGRLYALIRGVYLYNDSFKCDLCSLNANERAGKSIKRHAG